MSTLDPHKQREFVAEDTAENLPPRWCAWIIKDNISATNKIDIKSCWFPWCNPWCRYKRWYSAKGNSQSNYSHAHKGCLLHDTKHDALLFSSSITIVFLTHRQKLRKLYPQKKITSTKEKVFSYDWFNLRAIVVLQRFVAAFWPLATCKPRVLLDGQFDNPKNVGEWCFLKKKRVVLAGCGGDGALFCCLLLGWCCLSSCLPLLSSSCLHQSHATNLTTHLPSKLWGDFVMFDWCNGQFDNERWPCACVVELINGGRQTDHSFYCIQLVIKTPHSTSPCS